MAASTRFPGLAGAMLYDGGATFRVWAPNALAVSVVVQPGAPTETAAPLFQEDGGWWSADVPGAAAAQPYQIVVGGVAKIDPCARVVTNSAGVALIYDPAFVWKNDFGMPPWNELVIYELHARSFPDNPPDPADMLDAVAADLPYLQALGINAIEVMPAAEFQGDDSWGYDPSDVFAVESSYGGPDALKRLVDAAHALGIAVILDVVYNHFGPSDLSIWQFDGWFTQWNGQDMGGIYFYPDWRAYTPWAPNRPDYGRPEVRKFIRDNALMWLNEFRIDGLRFDSTINIRNVYGHDGDAIDDPNNLGGWGWNLMKWVNDEVNASQPWKITIAEDMQGNAAITQPTSQGGAGFDAQWDAGFVHPIRSVLTQTDDANRDMNAVRDVLYSRYNGDAFQRVVYTESHDEDAVQNGGSRLPEAIQPGQADGWFARKRSTLGAALVFTTPGIPMICQGQEILENIPFGDSGGSRIDWSKLTRFAGIHQLYTDLIHLRRNWFDATRGLRGPHINIFHVNNTDKLIAFHRWDNGGPRDDVVVVLNFANRSYPSYTIGLPRGGLWKVRFNSDWTGYSSDYGDYLGYDTTAAGPGADVMPCQGNVGIGPYTALILSQDD